jgi:hypothetical protein
LVRHTRSQSAEGHIEAESYLLVAENGLLPGNFWDRIKTVLLRFESDRWNYAGGHLDPNVNQSTPSSADRSNGRAVVNRENRKP